MENMSHLMQLKYWMQHLFWCGKHESSFAVHVSSVAPFHVENMSHFMQFKSQVQLLFMWKTWVIYYSFNLKCSTFLFRKRESSFSVKVSSAAPFHIDNIWISFSKIGHILQHWKMMRPCLTLSDHCKYVIHSKDEKSLYGELFDLKLVST